MPGFRRDWRLSAGFVAFPERVVVHAWASAKQLSASIDLLTMFAELRKEKELASHYLGLPARDQAAFVKDLAGRRLPPPQDAPCVCVLDWGVNRPHQLIKPGLDEDDMRAARNEWGVADSDRYQHGTGMAGNALYGFLTNVL